VTRARAALLAAATLLVLLAARRDAWPPLRGPAPYPPEWQWGYAPKPAPLPRLAPVVALAGALLALAAVARPAASRPRTRAALLGGCAVVGSSFQLALLSLEPGGAMAELERRTTSGSFTSYFKIAGGVEDAGDFLSRHHELLPRFRHGALHAATHPPGPILYYVGLRRLAAHTPRLASALGGEARAAALAGAALLGLLGAAACFPVVALSRALGAHPAAALRAGVLWTLVPGLCLMVPELDQALALPVAAASALVAAALAPERGGGGIGARAVGAGLLAGGAVFFSYGAPLLVALGAAAAAAPALRTPEGRRRAAGFGAVATAVGLGCFMLPTLLGHHPLASARTALALHREVFTARRSYPLWLAFDLLDLALFLGVPVVLFGFSLPRAPAAGEERARPFRLVASGSVLLLVASGLIRGEMGRILVPLMPVLLVACVVSAPRPGASDGEPSASTALVLGALLAATDVVLRLSWELP
jgi:hypothetical protein